MHWRCYVDGRDKPGHDGFILDCISVMPGLVPGIHERSVVKTRVIEFEFLCVLAVKPAAPQRCFFLAAFFFLRGVGGKYIPSSLSPSGSRKNTA